MSIVGWICNGICRRTYHAPFAAGRLDRRGSLVVRRHLRRGNLYFVRGPTSPSGRTEALPSHTSCRSAGAGHRGRVRGRAARYGRPKTSLARSAGRTCAAAIVYTVRSVTGWSGQYSYEGQQRKTSLAVDMPWRDVLVAKIV